MFKDAFNDVSSGGDPGFTCCLELNDPSATANERIDLVLYRGPFGVRSLRVVGNDPATGLHPRRPVGRRSHRRALGPRPVTAFDRGLS